MAKEKPDWFEKEDLKGLEKTLDKIIKKAEKRLSLMLELEAEARILKEKINKAEEEDTGFIRGSFVSLLSIMQHFLYVNAQDREEIGHEFDYLEELKKKLSKHEEE